jgi:cytochrome c
MSLHKGCLLSWLLLGSAALAEAPSLGVPLDPETVAALDYTVMPNGDGLPPGAGTVEAGGAVFRQHCIACHGADGAGAVNDALVGGQGSLATPSPQKTVGSYWPYATTLFDYIRRAMPYQSPGILADDDLYAVTAYILFLNGIIAEDAGLDQENLPLVKMPNRDGFIPAWPP